MHALVGDAIVGRRHVGRAQKRHAEVIPKRIVAILAVVQQAYAYGGVGDIRPAFCRDFKHRFLRGRVARGGTLNRAEWNFEGGLLRLRVYREAALEKNVMFVPVDVRLDIDTWNVRLDHEIAHEIRVLEFVADFNHSALGSILDQLHGLGIFQVPALAIERNLPRILPRGDIDKGLEEATAAAGRYRFFVRSFFDEARDAACFLIDGHLEKLILDVEPVDLQCGLKMLRMLDRMNVDHTIAK